jgi:N-acetylornithine carbamoyltransferase
MQTHLRGRDLITTQEWTKDELDTVLEVALDLKRRRALGEPHALLRDKVLAMLFFFSSTRTRASFEAAMAQLRREWDVHPVRDVLADQGR